jgi:hypothetical protein
MHFDRFRLLNGGKRFRNESDKPVYVSGGELDPALEIPPGGEADLPESPEGETIIEVPTGEPN